MKRAKVSSVYEGRGKKRTREEDQGASRMARMYAKARKYSSRGKGRAPCPRPGPRTRPHSRERTIMTRSMATTSNLVVEEGNQEMGEVVVDVEEEEKRSEINVFKAKPVGGVVEMPEEGLQVLEDWPPEWSYEEEWLWGGGMSWDPNWEVMTGDVWVGGEDVEKDDWVVDIWTFDI